MLDCCLNIAGCGFDLTTILLKMEVLKVATLYLAAVTAVVGADKCLPAEEGTSHNISCSFNVSAIRPDFRLFWKAVINNTYSESVASCSFGKCEMSPGFTAEILNTESILTINSVSRTDPFNVATNWRCEENRLVCNPLHVYARPTDVKCDFPPLNTSRDSMSMTCTAERVYPIAYSNIYISTDKVNFKSIRTRNLCQNTPRNETPTYFRSQCELPIQLSYLLTGDNYIKVKIYPDVLGGDQYGVESEVYQVRLSLQHGGSTAEVSTSLTLVIGLGVVSAITVCAVVFLGVSTLIYRRKCKILERQSTKQVSKDTPVGYNVLNKAAIDEETSSELYEDVNAPVIKPRPGAKPKPVFMENVYGNA